MTIGYIGLGKMGANMVERLLEKKQRVIAYDVNPKAVNKLVKKGAKPATSLDDLVNQLKGARTIWIMVPHSYTEGVVKELLPLLKKGDTIIDGGNSPFKQSMNLAKKLKKKKINWLDVGVSGGPDGARNGACMMIGGKKALFKKYEPLFKQLCVKEGYAHMGPAGSGHFVKMVHNGIEYGMMQSIAEGFAIMNHAKEFDLNMKDIAHVYNHGSVIESRLMEWMESGFKKYGGNLKAVTNQAGGLGEGAWTVDYAKQIKERTKVLEEAVKARKYSKNNPNYQAQIIMTLRNQFGGHSIKGNKKDYL